MEVTDAMIEAALRAAPKFWRDYSSAGRHMRAALEAALAEMWKPRSLVPHDSTVLVCVEPTEHNSLWNNKETATFPAYIDEDGRICDPSTWAPDSNLDGHMWRTTHFMPLPAPPPKRDNP